MKRSLLVLVALFAAVLLGASIRQLIHATVQSRIVGQSYLVSLGDSVASGAGLSGDRGRPVGCDLAATAYPIVLGDQLNLPVEQFACSGATVAATADSGTNNLSEQYREAMPYLSGSDIVIQAGANDVGWLQFLASCTSKNCATDQNRALLARKVQQMQRSLAGLLSQVQQQQPHRLLVNTYYGLLNPGDTCFERLGISAAEVSFIHNEEAVLNGAITAAAAQAKATPVVVDFAAHLLCDTTPWLQDIAAKAPLHPNVAGQLRIATQDAQVLTTTPTR